MVSLFVVVSFLFVLRGRHGYSLFVLCCLFLVLCCFVVCLSLLVSHGVVVLCRLSICCGAVPSFCRGAFSSFNPPWCFSSFNLLIVACWLLIVDCSSLVVGR